MCAEEVWAQWSETVQNGTFTGQYRPFTGKNVLATLASQYLVGMRTLAILLLESEPVVALDLKGELTRMGFAVHQAFRLSEAIEICQNLLPDIAFINFRQNQLTDGMSIARLLRVQYQMKVLLVTGARTRDLEAAGDFYAGQEVLNKPFTRRQFRQAMTTLLKK